MKCDTMAVDVTNELSEKYLNAVLSLDFCPTVSRVVLTIHKSMSWQNTTQANRHRPHALLP